MSSSNGTMAKSPAYGARYPHLGHEYDAPESAEASGGCGAVMALRRHYRGDASPHRASGEPREHVARECLEEALVAHAYVLHVAAFGRGGSIGRAGGGRDGPRFARLSRPMWFRRERPLAAD